MFPRLRLLVRQLKIFILGILLLIAGIALVWGGASVEPPPSQPPGQSSDSETAQPIDMPVPTARELDSPTSDSATLAPANGRVPKRPGGGGLSAGAFLSTILLIAGAFFIVLSARKALWFFVLNPRLPEQMEALRANPQEADYVRLVSVWSKAVQQHCPLYKPGQLYAMGTLLHETGKDLSADEQVKQAHQQFCRVWLKARIFLERNKWPQAMGLAE